MKLPRLLILAASILGLVAVLAFWRSGTSGPARFATPEECLAAHAAACKAGNASEYLDCLTGPLLDEARRLHEAGELLAVLRRSLRGVKSWVLAAPAVVEGDFATLDVDVARTEGTRRSRFRLLRTADGWRIAAIDAPRDVPTPIRHGTHVGEP